MQEREDLHFLTRFLVDIITTQLEHVTVSCKIIKEENSIKVLLN